MSFLLLKGLLALVSAFAGVLTRLRGLAIIMAEGALPVLFPVRGSLSACAALRGDTLTELDRGDPVIERGTGVLPYLRLTSWTGSLHEARSNLLQAADTHIIARAASQISWFLALGLYLTIYKQRKHVLHAGKCSSHIEKLQKIIICSCLFMS